MKKMLFALVAAVLLAAPVAPATAGQNLLAQAKRFGDKAQATMAPIVIVKLDPNAARTAKERTAKAIDRAARSPGGR